MVAEEGGLELDNGGLHSRRQLDFSPDNNRLFPPASKQAGRPPGSAHSLERPESNGNGLASLDGGRGEASLALVAARQVQWKQLSEWGATYSL